MHQYYSEIMSEAVIRGPIKVILIRNILRGRLTSTTCVPAGKFPQSSEKKAIKHFKKAKETNQD